MRRPEPGGGGRPPPEAPDPFPDPEAAARIFASFSRGDGSLHTIPSMQSMLVVVLDRIAQEFEPGRRYTEFEVVELLTRFHPDHAALRRHLVDDGFLTRESDLFWRSGGTFDV